MHKIKTLLGFDFGLKHIGVASGNVISYSAHALTSIRAHNGEPDWIALNKLLKEWEPDALLVGIPLNMNGSEQKISKAAELFALKLEKIFLGPVYRVDERLSTKGARSQLFEQGGFKALSKKSIDSVSAQIIIETWLSMSFHE